MSWVESAHSFIMPWDISGKSYDYTRYKFPFNHHNYFAFSEKRRKERKRENGTHNTLIVQLFRQHLNFISCSLLKLMHLYVWRRIYIRIWYACTTLTSTHTLPNGSIKWTIFARICICRRHFTAYTHTRAYNYILIMFSFHFSCAFSSSFLIL